MADPEPHTIYNTLKDFQPIIAALIAVGAACVALLGVMARVRFDGREAERKRASEELALFQRLRAALLPVAKTAERAQKNIGRVLRPAAEDAMLLPAVRADRLKMPDTPPEIAEAWSRLDLFSEDTIYDLGELRQRLPKLAEKLSSLSFETVFVYDEDQPDTTLRDLESSFAAINKICRRIRSDLRMTIEAEGLRGRYSHSTSHRSDSRESWDE